MLIEGEPIAQIEMLEEDWEITGGDIRDPDLKDGGIAPDQSQYFRIISLPYCAYGSPLPFSIQNEF